MKTEKFIVELTRLEIETLLTLVDKRVQELETFMLEGVKIPQSTFDTLYDAEYGLNLALVP